VENGASRLLMFVYADVKPEDTAFFLDEARRAGAAVPWQLRSGRNEDGPDKAGPAAPAAARAGFRP